MMNLTDKIFIAGHRGLVGSALVRFLSQAGFTNLLTRTKAELDLRDETSLERFFEQERPAYVFLAAAKVGGIWANQIAPADFIHDNLKIQTHVIHQSYCHGVKKLLFLGSSCIYPRECPQPIREDYLLSGPLEPTNEAYAIAKIAGIKMCQAYNAQYGTRFIATMPTNLYGPEDNFDLNTSHVLPALIRKFHEAKQQGASEVIMWGSGRPRREFLYVDDLVEACVYLMQHYDGSEIINIGTGQDIPILELAHLIRKIVGFTGNLTLDSTKPDGTPQKLLDVSRLSALGWQAKTSLRDGIEKTYSWYESRPAETRETACKA
jgi:GDP-L-fucose synthase